MPNGIIQNVSMRIKNILHVIFHHYKCHFNVTITSVVTKIFVEQQDATFLKNISFYILKRNIIQRANIPIICKKRPVLYFFNLQKLSPKKKFNILRKIFIYFKKYFFLREKFLLKTGNSL